MVSESDQADTNVYKIQTEIKSRNVHLFFGVCFNVICEN